MSKEPQGIAGQSDPQIHSIAAWLGDEVDAAEFPKHILRFANERAAHGIGLAGLDDQQWIAHFGRFAPLPGNLKKPLALKYHGHQFRSYNPDIGDGRGFLFAQFRDNQGRLLDLGTKGSGTTPYSRTADGRLTLKGAVREILATEMLEAQGVNTSKTFSVIETGEELWRGDEPSPTRSAVLVRLSHSHIRIGSFQRLAALGQLEHLAALVDYCLVQFPGANDAGAKHGNNIDGGHQQPAVRLMNNVVERMADLAASYMVAGFVHGVLNTDNMNITGESFDYGPWRWLPRWDPGFTAAYFDSSGLYAYGRQPEAIHWNCAQLAIALRGLVETEPLLEAINRYPALYRAAYMRRFCWRLGVKSRGMDADDVLVGAAIGQMQETGTSLDEFFYTHRGARAAQGDLSRALANYQATDAALDHPYWSTGQWQSMQIDEVETIWGAIADADDWAPLHDKIAAIRRMGAAMDYYQADAMD